jgi:hypothetical protein
MARASLFDRRIIGERDAADRVLQQASFVPRIAVRAAIVFLGVLAASTSPHAQTATIEQFQPVLSVCVLPPSPTPVAPWPVATTDTPLP